MYSNAVEFPIVDIMHYIREFEKSGLLRVAFLMILEYNFAKLNIVTIQIM